MYFGLLFIAPYLLGENLLMNWVLDKPPVPPPNSGYHRYVFLLLEGNYSNLTGPRERQHWGMGMTGHCVRDLGKERGVESRRAEFILSEA